MLDGLPRCASQEEAPLLALSGGSARKTMVEIKLMERSHACAQTCPDPAAFARDMAVMWARECNIYTRAGIDVDRVRLWPHPQPAPYGSPVGNPCLTLCRPSVRHNPMSCRSKV